MTSAPLALATAALMLSVTGGASAHDEDLRSGQLKITVGRMSEEVALARLRTAGVVNPVVTHREANKLLLQGVIEGRASRIELDTLTGHAIDLGANRRSLVGPDGALAHPLVTGRQLPVGHHEIAHPDLMHGVIVPRQE